MKMNQGGGSNKPENTVGAARVNYTHQVDNPEAFLRFDLTEGICWFPGKVENWLREIPLDSVIHYPSASTDRLQELIAQWLSVPAEGIALGNGSDELIELIPQIFLSPGDECLIVTPTFFRFAEASKRAGATVRSVALRIEDRFAWTPTVIDTFSREINRPTVKLIWLASPNNPTGVLIPEEAISMALESGKIVVLDKVLNGFPNELQTAAKLVAQHENVIILSGFSKTFGLPGLRLGFALTAPANAELLRERRLPFSISGTSQFLLERLLRALITGEVQPPAVSELTERRAWLEQAIQEIGTIKTVSDSTTNVLLLKSCSGISLFEDLKQQRILATNLNESAGIEGLGLVRLAVRSPEENELFVSKVKEMKE